MLEFGKMYELGYDRASSASDDYLASMCLDGSLDPATGSPCSPSSPAAGTQPWGAHAHLPLRVTSTSGTVVLHGTFHLWHRGDRVEIACWPTRALVEWLVADPMRAQVEWWPVEFVGRCRQPRPPRVVMLARLQKNGRSSCFLRGRLRGYDG
jgi:hypothetical protein